MNEKLRLARIRKHLSEREVCLVIGADVRTYQHWERGTHLPQPFYRKKLCAFFNHSLEELGFDPLALLYSRTGAREALASQRVITATHTPDPTETVPLPTDLFEIALLALRIGQQERGWSQDQMQEYLMSQMSHSHHSQGAITRREFGLLLAGLPLAGFALTSVPEELFPHCAANLTTAWKLAGRSDLALAQSIVSAYLPVLRPLAEHPSRYQQEAAELVAKCYILNGLIEMHLVHMEARKQSIQQAVIYAEISGNIDLIVGARCWLGSTYYYLHNPEQVVKELQQTEIFLDQTNPLLRSHVLGLSATALAQLGQRQEALTSLGRAQECFFVKASEEHQMIYTGHDAGTLALDSGRTYYALGDYQHSLETLLQIDGFQPKRPTSERVRLELLVHQTLAAARLNDLELATTYLKPAATGAIELGSKLRFSEALKAYHALEFLWPHEARIVELRPLFQKSLP